MAISKHEHFKKPTWYRSPMYAICLVDAVISQIPTVLVICKMRRFLPTNHAAFHSLFHKLPIRIFVFHILQIIRVRRLCIRVRRVRLYRANQQNVPRYSK